MEARKLTCIGCPMGCALTVELGEEGILSVTGNTCRRGDEYARKEVTHPTRIVTSTVRVANGEIPMVSCKTKTDVPKEKIMEIMQEINRVTVEAPVGIGDVLLEDVADTGVPVVATKDIPRIYKVL